MVELAGIESPFETRINQRLCEFFCLCVPHVVPPLAHI